MFSSLRLLTLGSMLTPPSRSPSHPSHFCLLEQRPVPQMWVFITKKCTKEPALFQGWQVNGISVGTERRHEIISAESACFHEGTHSATKGKGTNATKQEEETKMGWKLDLPFLYWMWYSNLTSWTHTVPPVPLAQWVKTLALAWLYVPFSLWLNRLCTVLWVEREAFYLLSTFMARAMVLTLPQLTVDVPLGHPRWLYCEAFWMYRKWYVLLWLEWNKGRWVMYHTSSLSNQSNFPRRVPAIVIPKVQCM